MLTLEQQDVVRGIVKDIKSGVQIVSMSGYAGAGKSFCMKFLAKIFDRFAVCAYTGKAANVLRQRGMTASTIHSLIYKISIGMDGKPYWELRPKFELGFEGFLVDEASMVSREIYDDLVSYGLPIVFVGDSGQLEPIGEDINVMGNPTYSLVTIHRNAGEIAFFAEHLRKGYSARTFATDKKVELIEPGSVTDEMLSQADQVICAFNRSRVDINARIRRVLGRTKLIEPEERIMCLRNNRKLGLFNGMQGEVSKVNFKKSKLSFWSDGNHFDDITFDHKQFGQEKSQFKFDADSPNPFDYAYCATCHKFQGSEAPNVIVIEQSCDKFCHIRWSYTAASRAKETLKWVCPKRHVPAWLK